MYRKIRGQNLHDFFQAAIISFDGCQGPAVRLQVFPLLHSLVEQPLRYVLSGFLESEQI